jgi:hypothetical protein
MIVTWGIVMDTIMKLVLVSLTPFREPDVICFQSELEFAAFKSYCRTFNAGYVPLTSEDAAKLLYARNGVGAGCYTMDGGSQEDYYYRKAMAKSLMIDVATFIGFIIINEPVQVSLDGAVLTNSDRQLANAA